MDSRHKNRKRNTYNQYNQTVTIIDIPLTQKYKDLKELYLENGIAYRYANKMIEIAPSQLRKVLDQIKSSVTMVRQDRGKFNEARDNLYFLVPITAYNTGRNKQLKELYDFVCSHVNDKALSKVEDILLLDQLFTSIIAYHKYFSEMRKQQC